MTRRTATVSVFTIGIVLGLTLAACGDRDTGDGIATADRPRAASGPPSADEPQQQRSFAECLRQHGVDVPDPAPGEPVRLSDKSDTVRRALDACREFAPPDRANSARLDPEAERRYAECMRRNGVPDFPDPDPEEGLLIPKSFTSSPQFEAADRICGAALDPKGAGK
jgi:hypothetical protein